MAVFDLAEGIEKHCKNQSGSEQLVSYKMCYDILPGWLGVLSKPFMLECLFGCWPLVRIVREQLVEKRDAGFSSERFGTCTFKTAFGVSETDY